MTSIRVTDHALALAPMAMQTVQFHRLTFTPSAAHLRSVSPFPAPPALTAAMPSENLVDNRIARASSSANFAGSSVVGETFTAARPLSGLWPRHSSANCVPLRWSASIPPEIIAPSLRASALNRVQMMSRARRLAAELSDLVHPDGQ